MSVFNNNLLLGAGGQAGGAVFDPTLIPNSVWLDGSADLLSKSFSGSASATEGVYSMWVQRTGYGTDDGIFCTYGTIDSATKELMFAFRTTNKLQIYWFQGGGPGLVLSYITTRVFRDIGWYHILFSYKTDEATADDRALLFINGIQETAYDTKTNPSASYAPPRPFASVPFGIGVTGETGAINSDFLDGYIAQSTFLDGHSIQGGDVAITDFLDTFTYGTNGSQFSPKANADIASLASAAGANSFCLDFVNSSDLGNDISSKNNDFSLTSMAAVNQSGNTPSNVYPTINVLGQAGTGLGTLSEGNTKSAMSPDNGLTITQPLPSTGLWYWEMDWTAGANGIYPGICTQAAVSFLTQSAGVNRSVWCWLAGDGTGRLFNGPDTSVPVWLGSAVSVGKIAVAWDADNTAMYFGTISSTTITWLDSGDPTSGSSKTGAVPFSSVPTDETIFIYGSVGNAATFQYLFDEDDWTGATNRPAAALSLSSANLPTPEFQGKDFFDTTLYEGNGQNQRVGDFVPFTDSFNVAKSAMFDDGDRRYLARTYSASDTARSSNSQATISYWIKFLTNGINQWIFATANSAQTLRFSHYIDDQSGQKKIYIILDGPSTNRNFIIPSGVLSDQEWTHMLYHLDVDNSTAADKVKCWVNGVQQTSTDTSYQGASNADYFLFANEEHFVGNLPPASAGYTAFCLNSYLAELNVLDGQLKAPGDFGEVDTSTNRWIPKDYDTNVGVYGNRGFYMEFLNPTGTGNGVGTDSSGNSFNFTESVVSGGSAWAATDQFLDTPSQNYATLDPGKAGSSAVLAQGNLKQTAVTDHNVQATMTIPKSGKWAFTGNIDALDFSFGVVSEQNSLTAKVGRTITSWGIIESSGASLFQAEHNSVGSFNLGSQPSVNHKLIAAIDMDLGHLWLGFNTGSGFTFFGGGNPATGATPTYQGVSVSGQRLYFAIGRQLSASFGGQSATLNGALPTGFLELNQDNLDDTASKLTALAWIKNRDATDNNMLANRVRGPQFINNSDSNSTGETTNTNAIQRFLQRGVQVGSDVAVNTENESFVLWQWLMGDSATTGSTTNPAGSIASSTIVSDANHMSIGTFTGTGSNGTVGHGLSAAPEAFVVFNPTAAARFKMFFHKDQNASPASGYIHLESTEAFQADATVFNSTVPTATVFSVGTNGSINENTKLNTFITWRSIPGVCKVGSYIGNGNADGPYIDIGFKPAFFLQKKTSGTAGWYIHDSKRNPVNVVNKHLRPSTSAVESTFTAMDFLSNGVKIRTSNGDFNTSTGTYVYIAMADIGGNGTLPPIYGR